MTEYKLTYPIKPWLSIAGVLIIYTVAVAIQFYLPCDEGIFIGSCTFNRFADVVIAVALLIAFFACVYWERSRKRQEATSLGINGGKNIYQRRFFFAALLFSILPLFSIIMTFANNPGLQQDRDETKRARGREQISFTSFTDEAFFDEGTGELISLQLTGVVEVKESGRYRIDPIRLKENYPIIIRDEPNNTIARTKTVTIDAGKPHSAKYMAELQPLSASEAERILGDQQSVSWKALWDIERIVPLFPGIETALARVYPDDSGEYSYVTHVNPEFKTSSYAREQLPIR